METSIERSPQHWCTSEGSNSECFINENDGLTLNLTDTKLQALNFLKLSNALTLIVLGGGGGGGGDPPVTFLLITFDTLLQF